MPKRSSSSQPLEVLYEDNHLIAVYKPAGLLTQGDRSGEASAMELVKDWLKAKYRKPGKVFLGLLHRLDRPVAGVLLFAKTSKGASRVSEQIRARRVEKIYIAAVGGRVSPAEGRLVHYVSSIEGRTEVHDDAGDGRKRAELEYRTLKRIPGGTLLEIRLVTGRKHQIRAQLAHIGHPVMGDTRYGSKTRWRRGGIGLVASSLAFDHPVQKERVRIEVPESLIGKWE